MEYRLYDMLEGAGIAGCMCGGAAQKKVLLNTIAVAPAPPKKPVAKPHLKGVVSPPHPSVKHHK
jgi:hypothetical protein